MERLLVHHRAPAGVDEHRGGPHQAHLPRAEHVAGGRVERHVQRHDVGGTQQLGEQHEADSEGVLRVLGQTGDVVVDDVHVERGGPPRDLLADGAEADDAEGLALQLVGTVRREIPHAPLAGHHVAVVPGELAVDREHQHQGVLGHRHRVGAAVVGHRHPRPLRRRHVEPVVAGTDQLHQLEARGRLEELAVELGAREPHVVADLGQRGGELRRARVGHDHLEAGRHEAARDVEHRGGESGGHEDLGGHRHLLGLRGGRRRHARQYKPSAGLARAGLVPPWEWPCPASPTGFSAVSSPVRQRPGFRCAPGWSIPCSPAAPPTEVP